MINVNMDKARDIHRDKVRQARKPLLEAKDVAFMRAVEAQDADTQATVAAEKQALRDATAAAAIDAATTADELKAAWDAGATWPLMNDAIMGIRHGQWRWDFAMASHGLYAHNPEEGNALLDKAIEQVTLSRTLLAMILKQLDVEKVDYPDISTKEKAHAVIGFDKDAAEAAKVMFIKDEVDKHWHPVARQGYEN